MSRIVGMEYTIQHHTRCCATTGRELREGEICYSAIVRDGSAYVRRDYSVEGWPGPPAGAVGFWKSRVEPRDAGRPKIDAGQVMELFKRLSQEAGHEEECAAAGGQWSVRDSAGGEGGALGPAPQTRPTEAFRWVLALFLVRKKQLKLQRIEREGGREVLVVTRPGEPTVYEVPDPQLSEAQLAEVQQRLTALLEADLT